MSDEGDSSVNLITSLPILVFHILPHISHQRLPLLFNHCIFLPKLAQSLICSGKIGLGNQHLGPGGSYLLIGRICLCLGERQVTLKGPTGAVQRHKARILQSPLRYELVQHDFIVIDDNRRWRWRGLLLDQSRQRLRRRYQRAELLLQLDYSSLGGVPFSNDCVVFQRLSSLLPLLIVVLVVVIGGCPRRWVGVVVVIVFIVVDECLVDVGRDLGDIFGSRNMFFKR